MRGEERGGGVGDVWTKYFFDFFLNYQRALSYLAWPAHYFFLVSKMKNILTGVLLEGLNVRRSPGLSPLPTDVNFNSPAPFSAPPPFTLFEFYDLYRNRVSVSPYIGKNNRHDFSFAELYPVLCQQFFALFFLVLTNSFFHEKSLLSNFNPPLLHSYRQNPNIEPRTA